MSTKQLYEKTSEGMKEVSPLVAIEDIYSKLSDTPLEALVSLYNHVKCEWKGSVADTRRTVPLFLRRSGLFITYNNGTKYITEFFSAGTDQITTEGWVKDSNWTPVPDEDYISAGVKPGVGTIGYEQLSDNLKQLFREKVNVTNFPDDEDIASVDNMLKFKDREVNAANFQSKGYVILRKNLRFVNGVVKNILTQNMINKPNTIYEIRYDFDLDGETIEISEDCVLKFEGGKLTNGTIRYNDTYILGYIDLENVFEIGLIHIQPFMFEVNPKFKQEHIQAILNAGGFILFRKGKYHLSIDKPGGFGLKIYSNTTIFLEEGCEFSISPNSYSHYSIFLFSGCQNIRVVGTLNVKGDNFSHLNNKGEWGDGVVFEDCNNITIDKIISNECFGDGVRFGGILDADKPYPEKITIGDILANRNGRTGVSVINAKDVYIGSIMGNENNRTFPKALIGLETTTANNIIQNFNIKSIVSKHNYGGAIWIINSNNTHDTSINIEEIISEEDSFDSAEYEAAIRFSSSPNEKDIQVCGQINIEKIKIIKPLKRGLLFSRWSSKEIPINIGHLSIEECKYDTQILVMADSTLREIGGLNIKETNIKSSNSQRGWLRVIGNQSTDIKIDFGLLNLENISVSNDIAGVTNNSNISYYSVKNNRQCCGIISPEGEVLDRTFSFTVSKVGTGQYNINLGTNDKGLFFVNFDKQAYSYIQSDLSNGKYRIDIYNSEKVLSDVRFNFIYFSFSNNYLIKKNNI